MLYRTPGTGLYHNLSRFDVPYPEAIFELDYFITNPKPFFTLAKEIIPSGKYAPNKIHYFIRLLQDKQLLHRLYTQNIDGLEYSAGIKPDRLVEAHGTFKSAQCLGCRASYPGSQIKVDFLFHKYILSLLIFNWFIFSEKTIYMGEIPYCDKKYCKVIHKKKTFFSL
jgi:NAD-dependent deacetylase sirtuin 3